MNDDKIIVTILIQTHGKVISYHLDEETTNLFQNVRLLCMAGGFVNHGMNLPEEIQTYKNLSMLFQKDIQETTLDLMKSIKKGVMVGNVSYDKSLAVTIAQPSLFDFDIASYLQGIYLLSVHKNGTLIFPKPNMQIFNFMNLYDLDFLYKYFSKTPLRLRDESTLMPDQSIYIREEANVLEDPYLSSDEKEKQVEQIRKQYFDALSNWKLTFEENKYFYPIIDPIRLSMLVKIVKSIFGDSCYLNLLDYSCNSPTIYIPPEHVRKEMEFEENESQRYGGRHRRKKRNTRKRRKRRKNKTIIINK